MNLANARYQRGRNIRNYTKKVLAWTTIAPQLLEDHPTVVSSFTQSVEDQDLLDAKYYQEQIQAIYYGEYR